MTGLHVPTGERLQKVLVRNGVGNRRACEDFIIQDRVGIDGHVVRELSMRVDPVTSAIHVDGIRVRTDSSLPALAFYRPPGVVLMTYDDIGRSGPAQYVEDRPERFYHTGRLDQDTEGSIPLSNDGELTHRLTHPKYEVSETYITHVEGSVIHGLRRALERGITLENGLARIDRPILRESVFWSSTIEITLYPGRDRIVRRMTAEIGHSVTELVRMKFGTIVIGHFKPGKIRVVVGSEFDALIELANP